MTLCTKKWINTAEVVVDIKTGGKQRASWMVVLVQEIKGVMAVVITLEYSLGFFFPTRGSSDCWGFLSALQYKTP